MQMTKVAAKTLAKTVEPVCSDIVWILYQGQEDIVGLSSDKRDTYPNPSDVPALGRRLQLGEAELTYECELCLTGPQY